MSGPTEADKYLLEEIRAGSPDGWVQLVERYQGRLLAFTRGHLRNTADAEDVVQDTFLSFLKGLSQFRESASIETYLFTLVRRRIVDLFRGRRVNVCSLQDTLGSEDGGDGGDLGSMLPGSDQSASWYARRDEDQETMQQRLADRIRELVSQMKQSLDFRNLRIAEMVFYAQLRNKEISKRTGVDEGQVALLKHRFLKRIARPDSGVRIDVDDEADEKDASIKGEIFAHHALLTKVWEELRPSCPKRSTIGAYLLGTLEEDWHEYVDFHLNELGCRFCGANHDDLKRQSEDSEANLLRDRIMQSSVGFLRKT